MSNTSLPNAALLQDVYHNLLSTRYMTFATSAMFVYDFILGISDDIHMFSLYSVRLPDVVYLISRTLTAGLSFFGLGSIAVPLDSCFQATVITIIKWVTSIVLPCNCWLFFLRACAIYIHSPVMIGIFAVLWAATLTSLGSVGTKVHSNHQADGTCEISVGYDKGLALMPFIALVIFDTAIIIAVSFHAISNQSALPWKERFQLFSPGNNTYRIQRTFLVSGQIYYLATIGIHITIIGLLSSPSVPSTAFSNVAAFSTAFHNIMASHVFRLLKLSPVELEVEDDIPSASPILFRHDNLSLQSSYITSQPRSYPLIPLGPIQK